MVQKKKVNKRGSVTSGPARIAQREQQQNQSMSRIPRATGPSGARAPANTSGRSTVQDVVAGLNALPRSTRTVTRKKKK